MIDNHLKFFKPLFPTIFQFYFNYSFSPCRKFHLQPNYRANWKKYIFGLLFVYLFIAVPSKSVGCLIYCMKLFVLIWRPKLREISTGTSQQFVAVDLLLYINFNRTYSSRPIREVPPDGVFNVSREDENSWWINEAICPNNQWILRVF